MYNTDNNIKDTKFIVAFWNEYQCSRFTEHVGSVLPSASLYPEIWQTINDFWALTISMATYIHSTTNPIDQNRGLYSMPHQMVYIRS